MKRLSQTCLFKNGQTPGLPVFKWALGALIVIGLGVATIPTSKSQEMKTESIHNPHHQNNWSEEQQEVWQVIEQFDAAFAANDPEEYFKFVGEEITVITPSNPYRSEGKPDDVEDFTFLLQKGISKVGLFQEMQPLVFVNGDFAFVTFYARGFFETAEKMTYWKITDVLQKTADGWRVIHIHVSD